VTYSVSGGANNSEGYNGGDSITGSAPGAQYTMSDSYNGSANGNTNYSLSESGQYANGVWTMSQFTESETTVTSANYSGSGNFSSSGPSGNESGNYQYTSSSSSNFSLYGVGQYANGSFSFQSFSASLAAQAGTTFTENASGPGFSYNRTDATAHSLNLGETGHNQIGNYTLTVTDSDYHSFTETINGATTSYTSSSSISCTTYGTFSLAGGNPFLPYGGNVGQAGGAGVGIQTPWYSRTTGASEGGTNGQGAGSNRVTNSVARIDAQRLLPVQTSGQDFGLPPATSDEPNLGLPVGATGLAGTPSNSALTFFSPGLVGIGPAMVPALIPPQPSPNNGPYEFSTQSNAEDCMCTGAGVVSVGYAPYLLGGGGGGGSTGDIVRTGQLSNSGPAEAEGPTSIDYFPFGLGLAVGGGEESPEGGRLAGSLIINDQESGLKGTLSVYLGSTFHGDEGIYIIYEGTKAADVKYFQVSRGTLRLTKTFRLSPTIRFNAKLRSYNYQISGSQQSTGVGGRTHYYGPNSPFVLDNVPYKFAYYSDNPMAAWTTTSESSIFDAPNTPSFILKKENGGLNALTRTAASAHARYTEYFITYVEYEGKIVARVIWTASATWELGYWKNQISDVTLNVVCVRRGPGKLGPEHQLILRGEIRWIEKRRAEEILQDMPGGIFRRRRAP
jgi:hypothetical protein